MMPALARPETLTDKIIKYVNLGLTIIALASTWLFAERPANKSWRSGLAIPVGAVVMVLCAVAFTLLEKRAPLGRHRTWVMPIAAFAVVFGPAMAIAAMFPQPPWRVALCWGVLLGALQMWVTARRLRRALEGARRTSEPV